MRYALVSDIHANWQAWRAVLTDAGSLGCERIVCLGDVVGYGPRPVQTLKDVLRHAHRIVVGNHEAALTDRIDAGCFNEEARNALGWAHDFMDDELLEVASKLPLHDTIEEDTVVAHADPISAESFDYIIDPEDAGDVWEEENKRLVFVGHTHEPLIFVKGKSGTPHRIPPQDFEMEPEKSYIVNVGSVGLPRDGDVRSSYCIFDSENRTVYFRRVPFDLEAFEEDFRNQRAPEFRPASLAALLDRQPAPVSRDELDFVPPEYLQQSGAKKSLPSRRRRRKILARTFAALAFLVFGVGVSAVLWSGIEWSAKADVTRIPAAVKKRSSDGHAVLQVPAVGKEKRFAFEAGGSVTSDRPLRQWTCVLADTDDQQVSVVQGEEEASQVEIISEVPRRIQLVSLPLECPSDTRYTVKASFKRLAWQKLPGSGENGYVEVKLVRDLGQGDYRPLIRKRPPNFLEKPRFRCARETMEHALSNASRLRVILEGVFIGKVRINRIRLGRKKPL